MTKNKWSHIMSSKLFFNGCAICKKHRLEVPGIANKIPSSAITTSAFRKKKKDFYAEEKLPIFDYGKIHPEKKRLYVFGGAAHGGLGLQNLLQPREEYQKPMLFMQRPVRHWFGDLQAVTDIAAGHGFTLMAVKPKGQNHSVVFGCGYNAKSQLGFQPNERHHPLAALISVVPLPLPIDKTSKVLAIGAGRGHSIISVEGKGLLALGENNFGQCGRKIIEDEEYLGSKYICRIPRFGSSHDHDVVQIASKFDISICVTRMGGVYTFGSNDQGQLGRGKDVAKPWQSDVVEGDLKGERVKKVATSGSSVLAVSEKGKLFGWGCNDSGQVDPSDISRMHYQPINVKLPRRIGKVIDVAMGDMFSLVLNEFGNVYIWGHGCALGLGPKNLVVKSPTLIPPPLFGRNEFSPDVSVVKLASSLEYAAAINSIGDLFTWGKNTDGCLGLGPIRGGYQFFPFKVALGGPVHNVSLGIDHSLVLAKAGF